MNIFPSLSYFYLEVPGIEWRFSMDQFKKYVNELFNWNKEMKDFLASEKVEENAELWEKLDQFTGLIESVSSPLSDQELVDLQSKAETIHSEMENYFKRKQNIGDIWIEKSVVSPGKHTLPDLSYHYDALEPYISKEIMELHHKKHHKAYVDGLNKAELELKAARKSNNFSLIKHWSRELSYHGSGHYLHTIFWKNMSPHGGGNPTGQLLQEIESYFGNLNGFQQHFAEAAKQVEGNGWAVLIWSPRARHLEIVQTEKHSNMTQWDTIPILVLDVWEHAYYLQYKNNREEYIKNWWKVVNWNDVEMRFDRARELKWQPF
jgi:Fe-Mn family superoxide dismutase